MAHLKSTVRLAPRLAGRSIFADTDDAPLTRATVSPYTFRMRMNTLAQLSLTHLKRAISIRGKIDKLQAQLDRLAGAHDSLTDGAPRAKKKARRMSRAA